MCIRDRVVGEELDGCNPNIGDILKAGQLVVVQIKKEAVDLKGPKVSCKLSLPGRMLVLVPGKPYACLLYTSKTSTTKNVGHIARHFLLCFIIIIRKEKGRSVLKYSLFSIGIYLLDNIRLKILFNRTNVW